MGRAYPEYLGARGSRLPREIWTTLYPLPFADALVATAQREDVAPALSALKAMDIDLLVASSLSTVAANRFLDKFSQYYEGAHGTAEGALALADLPALDFCLAVEDFPGITDHLTQQLGVPVALFDRPWNRSLADRDGAAPLVRCRHWGEILQHFPAP